MYGRSGLDRFKKAQSLEPFSVTLNSAPKRDSQPVHPSTHNSHSQNPQQQLQSQQQHQNGPQKPASEPLSAQQVTQIGGGQSTWSPPDWAIEPRPGFYYLEVMKDREVLDRINLDKRRNIFGRQFPTCDFVLDHQSVSRQHAAVVPHKNGSIYVIDLGSAHGTFVANERLTKDSPVELEVGQSLRFAASTRSYILRKNNAALFPPAPLPTDINLPASPDPSDEEAVLAYNTFLNRYGLSKPVKDSKNSSDGGNQENSQLERPAKRIKKARVSFKDQLGGDLVEVVGTSDGADVETEPGPLGVKEGSLVGKYESLVQTTIEPKGKEHISSREEKVSSKGVTDKLQEILNKVKATPKTVGIYDDLYGESLSVKVGSSWAYSSTGPGNGETKSIKEESKPGTDLGYDNDDLFGDESE